MLSILIELVCHFPSGAIPNDLSGALLQLALDTIGLVRATFC